MCSFDFQNQVLSAIFNSRNLLTNNLNSIIAIITIIIKKNLTNLYFINNHLIHPTLKLNFMARNGKSANKLRPKTNLLVIKKTELNRFKN